MLFAGLLFGCTGPGADFAELPSAPIALMYRTVEQTERIRDEVEAAQAAQKVRPENEFDIRLEGLDALVGRRSSADLSRDAEGQLGLFVAPEKRLELLDSLPRIARPLDWSPDHARLMFSSARHGAAQLFEWIVATGEVRQLTSGPEFHIDGCYGPEGAIAWVQATSPDLAAKTRIWVRRPGALPRPVTEGPVDLQPTWSPDGTRLVFTRHDRKLGRSELRWVDPTSGMGGSLGPGRSAAFSPDGDWIVYSARTAEGWKLRRMHADGSGKRSLGRSGYQEDEPSVSPDGRYVVFSAKKDAKLPISRLFVRAMDGAADRQLELSGSAWLPTW